MSTHRDEPGPGSRLDAIATRWTLVQQAHRTATPQNATVARQALVLRYAKAIRRYVGGILKNSEDADELAQEVVVRLMQGDFGGADPNRGRFRDLLKTAVRNMVHNHWSKSNRRKAADTDLETIASRPADDDWNWDAEWRTSILEHAWSAVKKFESENPTNPAYTLLRLRTEFPDCTSEFLAEKLGAKLGAPVRADACRQMLRRARLRFVDALVAEIGLGLSGPTPAGIADELAAIGLLERVKDFLPDDWGTTGVLRE